LIFVTFFQKPVNIIEDIFNDITLEEGDFELKRDSENFVLGDISEQSGT